MNEYEGHVKDSIFLIQKRERIIKIQNLMNMEKELPYVKLLAKAVMITGLSSEKAREYIQTLIDAGYLINDKGTVKLNTQTHT